MKRFMITLIASALIIFGLHYILYRFTFTYESVANSVFSVGIFMFFISLIIVTGANQLFHIVTYGFKAFFRKNSGYKTYYEYLMDKRKGKSLYGIHMFIISIGYIVISLILAKYEIDSRDISMIIINNSLGLS